MSKDIKEFLKYYIGCECLATGDIRVRFAGTIYMENEDWPLVQRYKGGEPQGQSFSLPNWDHIKPILRKLESMTEDEASDIYTIERDRILHPPTNDVDVRRVNNAWQIVRLDLLDTILWVTDEAIIYKVTEDNGKPMIEYTRNMPMIFHYLLSRGFWLFGNDWFDEGLIIDKATLK